MAALVSSPPLAVKALLTRRSKNDVRVWYVIKYGNALRAIRARPERASENECQQRVLATGRGDTELLNQICGIPDRYDISERALQEKKERKTRKEKKTERDRKRTKGTNKGCCILYEKGNVQQIHDDWDMVDTPMFLCSLRQSILYPQD